MSVDMLALEAYLERMRDTRPRELWLTREQIQVLISLIVESRTWSTERDKLQTENAALRKRLDGVLSQSVCTKCGWVGAPRPVVLGGKPGTTWSWMCGRDGCNYSVPEPKSAIIDRLEKENAELKRSLAAINDRFAEGIRILEEGGNAVHIKLFESNVRLREDIEELSARLANAEVKG